MPSIIDEPNWISNKLNTNDIDQISSVINFSIFWNLFEKEYFDYDYKPKKIEQMYLSHQQVLNTLNTETIEMLNFFCNRYYSGGVFTHFYDTLYLRPADGIQNIENVIQRIDQNEVQIFKAIITIIGRFRNNLFHGLKDQTEIVDQNELFAFINSYLSKLIDLKIL